jgi:hypothetical protein
MPWLITSFHFWFFIDLDYRAISHRRLGGAQLNLFRAIELYLLVEFFGQVNGLRGHVF